MLLEQFEAECISCGEVEKVYKSNITFEYKGKIYGFNLCKNHSTIIEPIIDLEKIIKTIKEMNKNRVRRIKKNKGGKNG